MKLFLPLLFLVAVFPGCAAVPETAPEVALQPPPGKIKKAVCYVQSGLPFAVEIDPRGAIFDGPAQGGELQHLKEHFLFPLAKSRYAAKIQRVRINAAHREWFQWTCIIELKDGVGPISITHHAGLYDGRDNEDPDGYVKARQFVLATLDNIGRHVGWSRE